MSLLEVRDLRVRRGSTCVLDGISFDLHPGVTMLLGRNGSGKSTLLRALLGMVRAEGSATLDGENLMDMSPRRRARRIAYLPQRQALPATMQVLDYVSLGASPDQSLFSPPGADARRLARRRMAELSISHLEARRMDEISGGEARLAALARSRMQNCRVLFMDEPLSGLDFRRQHEFLALLRREERAVLLSIHDPTLAWQYGDRILILDQGRLLADCGRLEEAILERALKRAYGPEIAFVQAGEGRLPLWNPMAAQTNVKREDSR